MEELSLTLLGSLLYQQKYFWKIQPCIDSYFGAFFLRHHPRGISLARTSSSSELNRHGSEQNLGLELNRRGSEENLGFRGWEISEMRLP